MRVVRGLGLAVIAAWHLCATAAGALVIDITGEGQRVRGRTTTALVMFDALAPQDRLALQAGGSVTLIYDEGGRQFVLRGPGRWELRDDAPATLQGQAPQALPPPAPALRPLSLDRTRVTAGAAAMRASGALDLAPWPDATRLLAPPPALNWSSAGEGARYRVTLATAEGQAVVETTVAAPSFVLAPDVQLRPGMSYAWSIEVESGPRQGTRAFASFTVADEADARQWSALRPPGDAPVSQWVLYANALDAAGYAESARQAWQHVRAQRPGLRLGSAP